MSLSDRIVSRIRTYVPVLVGAAAGWITAKTGIVIDPEDIALVITGVIALYYELARRLEERWPVAGRLLGVAKVPTYEKPPAS